MINKVEICGVNTAQLPTLTREEKQEPAAEAAGEGEETV